MLFMAQVIHNSIKYDILVIVITLERRWTISLCGLWLSEYFSNFYVHEEFILFIRQTNEDLMHYCLLVQVRVQQTKRETRPI